MLFQFEVYQIIAILEFITLLLQVTAFCGLIIFGISRTRNSDTINKSVVFPIVGVINITYFAMYERINYLVYSFSDGAMVYYQIRYALLMGLIPNILSLITVGALFLVLGKRNKENFGKFLMFSGIFWTVFGVIITIFYSIMLSTYTLPSVPDEIFLVSLFLPPFASIFMVTSSVFFLIYTIKVDVKILLFSSICLLGASCVFAANSLYRLIIYLL
jgi:hypothetical protein